MEGQEWKLFIAPIVEEEFPTLLQLFAKTFFEEYRERYLMVVEMRILKKDRKQVSQVSPMRNYLIDSVSVWNLGAFT